MVHAARADVLAAVEGRPEMRLYFMRCKDQRSNLEHRLVGLLIVEVVGWVHEVRRLRGLGRVG